MSNLVKCPDKPGVWLNVPEAREIDVYPLEPVGGTLCIWGPDVGAADRQDVWDNDEWQGHIPVNWFDDKGPWKFLRALD